MLERLQAAATVQQQPIDDASHELRTPLAILVTSADVTLDDHGATMTSYATGLERSRAAAERMTTVVDDLLVGARQRARTIDRELIDLSELAVEAADSMRPLAISRSVVIVVAAPTPVLCNADHASITRALTNPIDNAIFSPEDGTVRVAAIEESRFASVSVTDQGAVVAPADRLDMFEGSRTAGRDGEQEQTGNRPVHRPRACPRLRRLFHHRQGTAPARAPGP